MLNVNIDITGDLADLSAAKLSGLVLDAAAQAGMVEAEQIMANSKEIVPVDQGVLRASADAVGVQTDRTSSTVRLTFGYGGAAAAYSIVQHETPTVGPGDPKGPFIGYEHAEGKMHKFLERPAMEAIDGMESRLASAIKGILEG